MCGAISVQAWTLWLGKGQEENALIYRKCFLAPLRVCRIIKPMGLSPGEYGTEYVIIPNIVIFLSFGISGCPWAPDHLTSSAGFIGALLAPSSAFKINTLI